LYHQREFQILVMSTIRVVTDPAECRRVWEKVIPPETIYDLWEIRDCFNRQFRRPLYFIVAEQGRRVTGLIPLAWIEESLCYGFFPGETWRGKTWLEQNRIVAASRSLFHKMLRHVNGYGSDMYLRYLLPTKAIGISSEAVDESGYLFYPGQVGYSMDNYFQLFSHKSIKRILRDVAAFEERGLQYRYDDLKDIDLMIELNRQRYGNTSYFRDIRFADSFRELASFLKSRGWLRLTTLLVGGSPAAVDLGAVYHGAYTLLAGGTHFDFPGIAKVINLHHMRWACDQKINQVDFLCGEFSWKPMFHLTPRPLYLFTNTVGKSSAKASQLIGKPEKTKLIPGLRGVTAHA